MGSSSRSPPPPPLDLTSLSSNKFKFDRSNTADSDAAVTPITKRSTSYSSAASSSFSSSFKSPSTFIKSTPTVNVHTTCGRHTDQLLFSGPSLRDLARSIKRKL